MANIELDLGDGGEWLARPATPTPPAPDPEAVQLADWDEGQHPRDGQGRFTDGDAVPPEPGTAPIPDGAVRRFHVTDAANIESIRRQGLTIASAKGIEGPRAIYSWPDYESAVRYSGGRGAIVEHWASKDAHASNPFGTREEVPPSRILAVHEPWHAHYRYAVKEQIPPEDLDGLDADYDRAASALRARAKRMGRPISMGDFEGHPFRGNQWADGESAFDKAEAVRLSTDMLAEAKSIAGIMAGSTVDRRFKSLDAAPTAVREQVKAHIVKSLVARMGETVGGRPSEWVAKDTVNQWAASSGDSHPESVRMQHVVKDVFQLDADVDHLAPDAIWPETDDMTASEKRVAASARKTATEVPEWARAYVKAEYEATQEWFKQRGITHISVFRGQSLDRTIAVNTEVEVNLQPASSWTTSKRTAVDFAVHSESNLASTDQRGYVLSAKIPVARVLSTALTGRGCLSESEVVILGGRMKVRAGN